MGAGTEKYAARASIARERRRTSSPPSPTSGPPGAQKDGLFDDEIVPVEIPQRKGDPILFTDRRGRPGRHDRRVARRPAPRLRQGRQHHRRQRRRRSPTAAPPSIVMLEGRGRAPRRRPARASRRLRPGGRPRPVAAEPAGQRHPRRPSSGPACRWATSTCSSSTRPSPPSASPRWTTSASPTRSPTSTAAPSPSATRIGMSGTRVALHLLHELKRRGGGLGAAALCGGGGQGDALLVETL